MECVCSVFHLNPSQDLNQQGPFSHQPPNPLSLCMGVWPIRTGGTPRVSLAPFSWHTAQSQRACANSDTAGVNRVSQTMYTHWAGPDLPVWPSVTYKSTHWGRGNNSRNWNYNDVEQKRKTENQQKQLECGGKVQHTHTHLNQGPSFLTVLVFREMSRNTVIYT